MVPMTITDYLINAVFVLIAFRQARERELDLRSAIIPLAIVAYVAQMYVHAIPVAGNDLVLIAALGAVGLTLGIASGFATHVRAKLSGLEFARARSLLNRARQSIARRADWIQRQPRRRQMWVGTTGLLFLAAVALGGYALSS